MLTTLGGAAGVVLLALVSIGLYVRVGGRTRRVMQRCDELEAQLELLLNCSRTLARGIEQTRAAAAAAARSAQQVDSDPAVPEAPAVPTFASIDPAGVETHWVRDEVAAPADGSGRGTADAAPLSPAMDDEAGLSHTERHLLARLAPGVS